MPVFLVSTVHSTEKNAMMQISSQINGMKVGDHDSHTHTHTHTQWPKVSTVPSSPSLSPPSHHCPLIPITVPSFPSLSPPSHHCPLLPITVPSFPSLFPPSHHSRYSNCLEQSFSLALRDGKSLHKTHK